MPQKFCRPLMVTLPGNGFRFLDDTVTSAHESEIPARRLDRVHLHTVLIELMLSDGRVQASCRF